MKKTLFFILTISLLFNGPFMGVFAGIDENIQKISKAQERPEQPMLTDTINRLEVQENTVIFYTPEENKKWTINCESLEKLQKFKKLNTDTNLYQNIQETEQFIVIINLPENLYKKAELFFTNANQYFKNELSEINKKRLYIHASELLPRDIRTELSSYVFNNCFYEKAALKQSESYKKNVQNVYSKLGTRDQNEEQANRILKTVAQDYLNKTAHIFLVKTNNNYSYEIYQNNQLIESIELPASAQNINCFTTSQDSKSFFAVNTNKDQSQSLLITTKTIDPEEEKNIKKTNINNNSDENASYRTETIKLEDASARIIGIELHGSNDTLTQTLKPRIALVQEDTRVWFMDLDNYTCVADIFSPIENQIKNTENSNKTPKNSIENQPSNNESDNKEKKPEHTEKKPKSSYFSAKTCFGAASLIGLGLLYYYNSNAIIDGIKNTASSALQTISSKLFSRWW